MLAQGLTQIGFRLGKLTQPSEHNAEQVERTHISGLLAQSHLEQVLGIVDVPGLKRRQRALKSLVAHNSVCQLLPQLPYRCQRKPAALGPA